MEVPRQALAHSCSCHCSPSWSSHRQLDPWSKCKWDKERGDSRSNVDQSTGHRSCEDKSREDRQDREGRSRCRVGQGNRERRGR